MAVIGTPLNSEWAQRAMLEGLKSHLRSALEEKFQAVAKEVIDEAIARAMETFEVSLRSFNGPMAFKDTIEVILHDQREKAAK